MNRYSILSPKNTLPFLVDTGRSFRIEELPVARLVHKLDATPKFTNLY